MAIRMLVYGQVLPTRGLISILTQPYIQRLTVYTLVDK